MRDPKRIPVVLELILKYWEKHPDLRIFQVMNILQYKINEARGVSGDRDLFYLEDEELIRLLKDIE